MARKTYKVKEAEKPVDLSKLKSSKEWGGVNVLTGEPEARQRTKSLTGEDTEWRKNSTATLEGSEYVIRHDGRKIVARFKTKDVDAERKNVRR
jgi:hypothetical protein